MRTTWKPFSKKTKLTFLFPLTFLFLFSGYKFKKKDTRAIGKAIGVLLLYCLAIWVFLILGALLLGYVFGVDV